MSAYRQDIAVDADAKQRPGIPMELEPPRPAGNAHWAEPARQRDPGGILKRKNLPELTPVFGTSVPPRGLSGLMRRAGYAVPEHYTSHWLLLLLADRVDVVEDRLKRVAPVALPLLALGGVAYLTMQRRRSPWERALRATSKTLRRVLR